ncbi:hypothetical protein HU200_061881 [Digitaria exilis]|uniref:BTB domain-containing protein n=1 Tax=Digitaria exilis TaxID=1010633 RepID=A0A835AB72_9POAL|nr:hypothetical protein HU200_061881 [Digitaria exilis]
MSAAATSIFTHQFRLNFEETKHVPIGHFVNSGDISSGGHLWRINCFPQNKGEYISVYLHHESETKDAQAIFEVFCHGQGRCSILATALAHAPMRLCCCLQSDGPPLDQLWRAGRRQFVKRSDLESHYVTNGSDDPISVPPSDIVSHIGSLLDSTDGSDVSLAVDGEEFPAHRAVLAARSPVFKAQLLGSMADAKMEKLQDLFAAADRYALDRLKLLCANKLWDDVSADTIGATLALAERYSCPELKKKCIDFFGDEKNFRKAVLTDGFIQMVQKFPSVLAELRVKIAA